MKHLSQKQCIDLMLDLAQGSKAGHFLSHIKKCEDCKRHFDALLTVLKPGLADNVVLSKNLKNRILTSAARIRMSGSEEKKEYSEKNKIWKPAIIYSSIAIAAAVIFTGIISLVEINTNRTFLHVARMYGKAEINTIPARIHDLVSSGNTISTDDDSVMMLRTPRNDRIMIFSKSRVTVERAGLDSNKDLEVKYNLDDGIVYSKHNEDVPGRNEFATPNALIHAQDADMMLKVSNNTSSILLIKGKIVIWDPNSSNNIAIDSPGRYIISDGIKTTKQEDSSMPNSQNIDEALTIHENGDEITPPVENFDTGPVCNDFKNVNKMLIKNINSMLPE
jgi:hypothetical protein